MSRLATLLAVVTAVSVIACETGTTTPRPTPHAATPAPTQPTADVEAAVRAMAGGSVTDILGGASTSPFLTNWQTIQTGSLPLSQKTQFCQTLQLPFADKVISGIVSVGLNALSLALHKKPIAEEAKGVIDLVASFAVKTCPQWDPTRASTQTPKPSIPWYPRGYTPLLADPGVAWQWANTGKATCAPGSWKWCWNVDVVALRGCPTSLFLAVTGRDSDGVVVDPGEGDLGPIAANTPFRVELTSDVASGKSAAVDFISCS